MSLHDLTLIDTAPYVFAERQTSDKDKKFTAKILRNVRKHLAEFITLQMKPNSVSFINKSRRSLRIIFYDVEKMMTQKDTFVVIFYAHKRDGLSETDNKHFFDTDWNIAMSLMGERNILCYASQELLDGNWFNVVLFEDEGDKHKVLAKSRHSYAAYSLAPKRFKWVRLHNAVLPGGILDDANIKITRTKYYYFDSNWFAERTYTQI